MSAEKIAQLMWRTFEMHTKKPERNAAWHRERGRLFALCDAADRRLWGLREAIAKETGAWYNPDYDDSD
jgi:hypothetical protein